MVSQHNSTISANRSAKTLRGTFRHHGFTLIELMVTTSIVALLVATAMPVYEKYTVRAKITEGITLLGSKKNEISDYYMNNKEMPRFIEDLGWPSSSSPNPGRSNSFKNVFGKRSNLWTRIGINSSGKKGKDQYVNLYLRTKRLDVLNNKVGILYIQAKASGNGTLFRCSVNRREMMSVVPSKCSRLRGRFARW